MESVAFFTQRHYCNDEPNGQMAAGHTFTIEPMICGGSAKVLDWPDDWTATTVDGKISAQFEHTLLIAEDGVEALTANNEDSKLQFWEKESDVHRGFLVGTSAAAKQRAAELNGDYRLFMNRFILSRSLIIPPLATTRSFESYRKCWM
jgi:hypothetical protein